MRKSKIEVEFKEDDLLREEVRGLTLTSGSYIVKLPNTLVSEMNRKMEKLRDKRDDWPGYMYMEIKKRMKLNATGTKLDINKLHTDETLIAFANRIVEHNNFSTTPKQKTIKEST